MIGRRKFGYDPDGIGGLISENTGEMEGYLFQHKDDWPKDATILRDGGDDAHPVFLVGSPHAGAIYRILVTVEAVDASEMDLLREKFREDYAEWSQWDGVQIRLNTDLIASGGDHDEEGS